MTSQEKKAYLERYAKAGRELDRLCEELARWRSMAEKITPVLSQEPAGGNEEGNQIESAVEKIVALKSEIEAEMEVLYSIRQQVVDAVKTVPDETLQLVLSRRYILGETWEQVAVNMHYGYQWVCRLHGRALRQVNIKEAIESDTQSMI